MFGQTLTCFKDTKKKSHHGDGGVAIRCAKTHGNDAPSEHEEGNPSTWLHTLEEVVGGHFENCVRNEKHHEGNRELKTRHAGHGEQIVTGGCIENLGIANVGAVQVAKQIDASS